MNQSIAAIVIGVIVAVGLALGSAFYLGRTERAAVQAGGPTSSGKGKDASRLEPRQDGGAVPDPSTSGTATDGAAPASR
ncbi:MAG: hypothetical protein K2Y27_05760 [Xanthobacteraceae bacterium]|nr:hypothetical protein [Xanthobacteraceae bacterium]